MCSSLFVPKLSLFSHNPLKRSTVRQNKKRGSILKNRSPFITIQAGTPQMLSICGSSLNQPND
nr:MAG TPA: hypothetical protein [Caudoviricetes sp.]